MPTRRKLPVPKAPAAVQTVSPEQLVAMLNRRWNELQTLTATVTMQVTELKTKQGVAETLPPADGWILLRKPDLLRVTGNKMGARMFDMVSNGKAFTLTIPLKNMAIEGSDASTEKSPNPLYNLRPWIFLDAICVRGLGASDHYAVISNTETVEDAKEKRLLSVPEYILNVARLSPGSQQMTEVRVVTIHREDLLPYDQEIYDSGGDLEAQVRYEAYHHFGRVIYPSKITINCPQAEVRIGLAVSRLEGNRNLPDDRFELRVTPGMKVQQLK
jgi:outer membrane lipoprotein-sorting protein